MQVPPVAHATLSPCKSRPSGCAPGRGRASEEPGPWESGPAGPACPTLTWRARGERRGAGVAPRCWRAAGSR